MNRTVKLILAINLLALTALVFVYPHLMISPGKLIVAHQQLETDCFACHQPLLGSTAERCIACHATRDIGRLTTTGHAIVRSKAAVPFHQELIEDDCTACHSDHAGVKRYEWRGRFDHSLLKASSSERCSACHESPKDDLHRQIDGNCGQCHTQKAWTPATFDHDKYFVLDRDHDARCVTCHVRNDYSRYTCYGCHEHTPANIRREHIEEGIRDFENCVECHVSADEHDIRGRGERDSRRDKRKRQHEDGDD
ncbi:MAG: class III cytochrome C family protein [Gammaproteobacteria bacterium]|nr:class III cytochrome C family protein [Gammaproteobacteria bacterium]MBU1414637.1 class III cytochrome C family protein [Gammaproteobacteria bacterium]